MIKQKAFLFCFLKPQWNKILICVTLCIYSCIQIKSFSKVKLEKSF